MLPAIDPEIEAILGEIVDIRRDFHRHPELAFEEFRTSARVAEYLANLGLNPVTGIAQTGISALIEGEREGPTLLLRADMDALPIQEESGLDFASTVEGKMHACGHDFHTAILMGTARLLQARRQQLRGRVKLVFQPAEEGPGGALPMVEAGILENPEVDYAVGLHLWSTFPCGQVAVTPGPVMAAADTFRVVLHGRGGHAAYPHECADPITAAAALIGSLQTIISRRTNPFDTAVLSVTRIEGGSADNVIPERVEFSGTVRSFQPEIRDQLVQQMEQMIRNLAQAYGVESEFLFRQGYPPLVNHPLPCSWVQRSAESLGLPQVPQATMGGEDMAYYLQRVPGAFFFLGAGMPEEHQIYPHHHPKFQLDERALPLGIEMFLRIVEQATRSD